MRLKFERLAQAQDGVKKSRLLKTLRGVLKPEQVGGACYRKTLVQMRFLSGAIRCIIRIGDVLGTREFCPVSERCFRPLAEYAVPNTLGFWADGIPIVAAESE